MKKFEYRHALLTGGSSGIGVALGRMLVRRGVDVTIVARNEERLAMAKKAMDAVSKGAVVETRSADVANYADIEAAVNDLVKRKHPPDLLINSAGIVYTDYFEKIPLEQFHRVMEVDYFGTLNAVRAVLPSMLANGKGHIVNISSAAGYVGIFGYSTYCPAKFAVRGFSESISQELKPRGILVSVVYPPDTDTPQHEEELKYRPEETNVISANASVMSADAVASSILAGIEAHRFTIIPGFMNKITYLASLTPLVRWICDRTIARVQRTRSS